MPSALEVFNRMLAKAKGNEDVSGWAKEVTKELPELKDFIMFRAFFGFRNVL